MARKIKSSDWATVAKAQDSFRYAVVRDSKRNLLVTESRIGWSGRTYSSPITNSGSLYSSIRSSRKYLNTSIWMNYYGEYIDQGAEWYNRWPPRDKILEWIKSKPILPRDEKGRFTKRGEKEMISLAFLIQRSLFRWGLRATYFFNDPLTDQMNRFEKRLLKNFSTDLDNILPDDNT